MAEATGREQGLQVQACKDEDAASKSPSLKVNALSNTTSLLFNVVIGFYTTRLSVAYLDEERFGMWMLTTSVVGYFGLLQMGVGTGVLRYAPLYRGTGQSTLVSGVISTAMAFYSVLGILIFILCQAFSTQLAAFFKGGDELAGLIRIVGLATALECPTWVVDATIRSFEKFVLANFLVNMKALLRAGAVVVCVAMHYDLFQWGVSLMIVNLIMLIVSLTAQYCVCKGVSLGIGGIRKSTLLLLVSFGIVVLVTSAAETLTFGSAKAILGRRVSLESVGVFSIAALLINYYRRAIFAVTRVFMPRFSYLQGTENYVEIRRLYLSGSRFAALSAGFAAVLLWTMGPAFLRLWLSKDYSAAVPALMILTAGTLVLASNRMAVDLMYGLGKQTSLAWMAGLEGLSVLGLSLVLSGKYGLVGVAIGMAVPIALTRGILQAYYVCRLVGMKLQEFYAQRILWQWLLAASIAAIFWLAGLDQLIHGFWRFCATFLAITAVYAVAIYWVACNSEDRAAVLVYCIKARRRIGPLMHTCMRKAGGMIKQGVRFVKAVVGRAAAVSCNITKVNCLVKDSGLGKTYYPELVRKSPMRIYLDNLAWLVRYGEINEFYFVYGFDRKHGVDQCAYMDYSTFRRLRNKANASSRRAFRQVDYRCLLADKFAFAQYLGALGFATPRVVALCDGNSMVWCNGHKQSSVTALAEHGPLEGFLKDITGQCAQGVHTLTIANDTLHLDGSPILPTELAGKVPGMWILQERIKQHPKMALLYPQSVNTIRLVTIYESDGPTAFSALIRIGARDNYCDNWAIGGLLGSIDLRDGTISKYCMFKPGFGGRVERHPETKVVFDGFTIPFFNEAVRLALSLHRYFYGVHSIGWDIAITGEGPVFIEGNDNWELSMHQALEGGLRTRFSAAIRFCG